jgi:hypothetical protein
VAPRIENGPRPGWCDPPHVLRALSRCLPTAVADSGPDSAKNHRHHERRPSSVARVRRQAHAEVLGRDQPQPHPDRVRPERSSAPATHQRAAAMHPSNAREPRNTANAVSPLPPRSFVMVPFRSPIDGPDPPMPPRATSNSRAGPHHSPTTTDRRSGAEAISIPRSSVGGGEHDRHGRDRDHGTCSRKRPRQPSTSQPPCKFTHECQCTRRVQVDHTTQPRPRERRADYDRHPASSTTPPLDQKTSTLPPTNPPQLQHPPPKKTQNQPPPP